MAALGKVLQLAGLTLPPLAIWLELQSQVTLWQSLTISSFGATLFALGYVARGYGEPNSNDQN